MSKGFLELQVVDPKWTICDAVFFSVTPERCFCFYVIYFVRHNSVKWSGVSMDNKLHEI